MFVSASVNESEKLILHPDPDQPPKVVTFRVHLLPISTMFGRHPFMHSWVILFTVRTRPWQTNWQNERLHYPASLAAVTTSCASRSPPQYAPPHLDFWPFELDIGVRVACDLGYPCAKFRLPRPFGFQVRADVRDIRQTDGQTDDRRRWPLNAPASPTGAGA